MTTLGEYIKVQGGYAYKSKDFIEFSKNKVLKIKNVRFGTIDYAEPAYVSDEIAESTKNWKVKEGDVLISMTGSGPNAPQSLVGRVARVWKNEPDAWINQRVGRICLLDEDSVHLDFIFYWLSLPQSQDYLVSNSSGSANQANISGKTIESLPCPKVDYQTSKQIADLARKFDEKVILNSKTNQTLEEMAQAIFKSWFVDFDPVKAKMNGEQPEGMDEATASLFPEKLVESELGLIPEGWRVKKIGDVVDRYSVGKKYSQKTAVESGLVPILDQGKSGIIGYHNDKPGVKASLDNPIIVFANHTCYMKLVTYDFSAIQNVLPFKLNGCDIYWSYLATQGKQRFVEYKGHWPDFMIHEIVIPSEELMQRFGELIKPFYSQMASNENQNKSLAKLRDTLLPKLLSGEIELSTEL